MATFVTLKSRSGKPVIVNVDAIRYLRADVDDYVTVYFAADDGLRVSGQLEDVVEQLRGAEPVEAGGGPRRLGH